jgi:hypothetical protein
VKVKFQVHGITNHVLLKESEFGLAKPKLALSVGTFYNHSLVWVPQVTNEIGLGMRLNPQVCIEGAQIGGLLFDKISEPKKGVWCNLRD